MVAVDHKLMRRRKRAGTCALSSDGWRGVPPGVNPGGSFCRNISQLPSSDAHLVTTQTWGVTQRYVYSPYGSLIVLNADFSTPPAGTQPISDYLYQGMTLDAVTGLYYARNRNYSPSLGVWISQDPLQYINGANTYQMEMSGPVGAVDPEGLAVTGFVYVVVGPGGQEGYVGKATDILIRLTTGSHPIYGNRVNIPSICIKDTTIRIYPVDLSDNAVTSVGRANLGAEQQMMSHFGLPQSATRGTMLTPNTSPPPDITSPGFTLRNINRSLSDTNLTPVVESDEVSLGRAVQFTLKDQSQLRDYLNLAQEVLPNLGDQLPPEDLVPIKSIQSAIVPDSAIAQDTASASYDMGQLNATVNAATTNYRMAMVAGDEASAAADVGGAAAAEAGETAEAESAAEAAAADAAEELAPIILFIP